MPPTTPGVPPMFNIKYGMFRKYHISSYIKDKKLRKSSHQAGLFLAVGKAENHNASLVSTPEKNW